VPADTHPFVNTRNHIHRLRNADLNGLLVLSVLLTTCGVSRTAAQLSLSQPAVSRVLERMRRQFDDALLVRSGNRMVLTPKGRQLLPLVEDFLQSAAQVVAPDAGTSPESFDREVSIGCSEYVQIRIAGLLPRLRQLAPGLQVNLLPMLPTEIVHDVLAAGQIDLMVGMMTDVLGLLRIEHLYSEPFVCLMKVPPGQMPPAGLSFNAFCQRPHLDVSPTGRRILGARIDSLARQQGGMRTVAATISSFVAAPHIVADTDMVCLVPQRIAQRLQCPPDVKIVDLLFTPPTLEIVMYWHNVTQADPVCRWLRQQFALALGEPSAGASGR